MASSDYERTMAAVTLDDAIDMLDDLERREVELENAADEHRDPRAILRCSWYLGVTRAAVAAKLERVGMTLGQAREALAVA